MAKNHCRVSKINYPHIGQKHFMAQVLHVLHDFDTVHVMSFTIFSYKFSVWFVGSVCHCE